MTEQPTTLGDLEQHLTLEEVGDRTPETYVPGSVVGWVTLEQAGGLWEDADLLETSTLATVLSAGYEDAVDYLRDSAGSYTDPRELDPPQEVPARWRVAQVMLARHIWARMRTGNSDSYGPDGMQLSTYPLVLEARAQLRPKRSPLAGIL